jgi:hypothetical protein
LTHVLSCLVVWIHCWIEGVVGRNPYLSSVTAGTSSD